MQLKMLTVASKLDWKGWLLGIWSSAISAAAGAIAAGLGPMITDPTDFNLGTGLHHTLFSVGIGAAVTGIVSIAKYLQMHPTPDPQQAVLKNALATAAVAIDTAKAVVPDDPKAKL